MQLIYHTGVNGKGQNWRDCTPDFIECHLNPYLEFVGTIFPEHVRKTCALNYVPQSPLSATVIPPTMDFVGAASTSNTSPQFYTIWWTLDLRQIKHTESFIDETEVLLPAHPAASSLDPHTPLLYNKYQSLSYNPPPSSSQTGTEVLLSAHPATIHHRQARRLVPPILSWTREVWDQQVSSPLCSSTPHFQMGPSYIFPNSHLPRSGSEPAIPAAPATPAAPLAPAAPATPAAHLQPTIDEHLD
ncbi:hypothetical protein DFJ58DRAFT_731445 [Suillus subalutaceus]|uniref:uncharacterized protein n=1 Tax=Suillus subalutaceus TaxID=48586 RepID=UPI001B87CEB1|nr:uncharacterized protein DFJ58DRAFT_731445 [Suillus subalutaceus]KAG1843770.1 hypothetical protein DFJ58DRAFT_731445 [Suillus subalutaceus]